MVATPSIIKSINVSFPADHHGFVYYPTETKRGDRVELKVCERCGKQFFHKPRPVEVVETQLRFRHPIVCLCCNGLDEEKKTLDEVSAEIIQQWHQERMKFRKPRIQKEDKKAGERYHSKWRIPLFLAFKEHQELTAYEIGKLMKYRSGSGAIQEAKRLGLPIVIARYVIEAGKKGKGRAMYILDPSRLETAETRIRSLNTNEVAIPVAEKDNGSGLSSTPQGKENEQYPSNSSSAE